MGMNKVIPFTMLLFFTLSMLVGCQTDHDVGIEENEPITLTIMMWDGWGQDYETYIKGAVEEHFPHITLENIGGDTGNRDAIEDALASQIVPDLIFAHRQNHVDLLREYELGYDMTELIEKHEFDISRYDPAHLQEWSSWSDGEIWLLPLMSDRYALHYNKDIFDLFGVDYPTDGMTWEEVIDLSTQVTGQRDGVQYQGLHISNVAHFPLSPVVGNSQLIDPNTDEVLWTENPYVREWLSMVERVHTMPGNEFPEGDWHAFAEARTLAMVPLWLWMGLPEDMNWDLATYPQWEDAPNVGPYADGWSIGVTAASEQKDEAFEVLKFLYEDEQVMYIGDSPMHAPFPHLHEDGYSIEHLEDERFSKFLDKNLEALFQLKPSGGPESRSKYDVGALPQIENAANEFLESELDINSFLREMKEMEEIRIKEEKARE